MSVAEEIPKINCELAQYSQKNFDYSNDDLTEQSILLKSNINHKLLTTKYLESYHPELIGCTALHFAAKHNKVQDIEFFLRLGADPTIKNQNGLTPLLFAINDNCKNIDDFLKVKLACESLLSAHVKSKNLENPIDENGLSHFHVACMANHAEATEYFLRNGVSVNDSVNMASPHFSGYTPLHLAAKYSARQAIEVLLKFESNAQLKNSEGMTFLCTLLKLRTENIDPRSNNEPCLNDPNLELMNFLLQNDSYVTDYKGLTHFHIACSGTELSIAERLMQNVEDINHSVEIDATHWPGYTALHFAAYSSMEMVKMLVKNGANLMAEDANGVTPLDMFMRKYELEDVHAVLSLDATWTSIFMSDRKTRLLSLIFAMKDTNQFDNFLELRPQIVNAYVPLDSPVWQGFTPLHIAIMFYEDYTKLYFRKPIRHTDERSEHIMKKLIANDANLNVQDIRRRSPIHLGFWRNIPRMSIELLLESNENIENTIDNENLSHLHVASKVDHVESVKKILQTKPDVNLASKKPLDVYNYMGVGSTPLHCAPFDNEITGLLLQRGANPLLKDVNGVTAIHRSAYSCSKTLLSSPNLKDFIIDELGLSHLHVAVKNENVAAAEQLLDNGADVNQALLQEDVFHRLGIHEFDNSVGDTPLDLALYGEKKMIELLLQRGAEILIKEPALIEREGFDTLKPLISPLNRDDNLFKRLKKEIGLTMLHVACSRKDIDLIKTLLANGANVNAQINVRSRLWPGYTALHVVMDDEVDENVDEIVRLLLHNGADITLTEFEQETALHLAFERTSLKSQSNRYSSMRMILKAHKDFTINPARLDGLSHFHVACSIGDINVVRRFLKHGADVNQPIDYFMKTRYYRERNIRLKAGFTPLHCVAASNEYAMDATLQLELVDLLLKSHADVNAEDTYGNTALHLMAQWNYKREDVIFRLFKSALNSISIYIQNKTPLEILMIENDSITVENIKCFLKIGCLFNVFTSNYEGLIAIALKLISAEDLVNVLKSVTINFPNCVQNDKMGRTIIHNIVSIRNQRTNQSPSISNLQYAMLFKEFDEFRFKIDTQDKSFRFDIDTRDKSFRFNIDTQDKSGKTPLHFAVMFRNTAAITGLLMSGADINVIDASGKTAFSYLFESCNRCERNTHHECQYDHTEIIFNFVIHLKKLLLCGLDVNQINEKLMFEAFEKFKSEDMSVAELFKEQINERKNVKIPESKLTIGNFLSETDAVVAYKSLPEAERNAVDEFFKDKISDLRRDYSEIASILLVQYRKAVNRVELVEPALSALNTLARFSLPDLCSTAILKLLTNLELSSMIEATT